MKKRIFKAVLWAAIEDYTRLIHIPLEIYNEIDEKYDSKIIEIAKKVLQFYLQEGYISLFYEKWTLYESEFIEISKEKSQNLILENSSWEEPKENIFITISSTPKGEDLYL